MSRTLLRLGLAAALLVPVSFVVPAHAANRCAASNPAISATDPYAGTKAACTYTASGFGRFESAVHGRWYITRTYTATCTDIRGRTYPCSKSSTIASGTDPNQGLLSTKAGDVVNVVIDPSALGAISARDS